MTPTLEELRAAGLLSAVDLHFARAIGRIGKEPSETVLLAAALVSRQVGNGHVCLDLPRLARSQVPDSKSEWPAPDASDRRPFALGGPPFASAPCLVCRRSP